MLPWNRRPLATLPPARAILAAALLLAGLWAGAASAQPATAPAATPAEAYPLDRDAAAYLATLQDQAEARQLAADEAWLALLHYKRHPISGRVRSLADDSDFFNAADGADDAAAELRATLAAFFDPRPNQPGEQSAQCRFPARLAWLRRTLAIDVQRLPLQACERFEEWRAGLQARSVSLIFPTAYVNSPASMYGHTFLRINQGGVGAGNPMLAYTISYAANGNEAEGLGFAFKGLTGLYAGIFTTTPYYRRLEEYTHLENRDIWEYDLALDEAEIAQLLAHTWELGFTRFDYYFFDENCSYHLLSLLDVARPGLRLTDRFTWWALPVDTVSALFEVPGLVGRTHFRPSNSTDIAWRAQALDDAALAEAREVGLGQRAPRALLRDADDPLRRARALELAERYASYRGAVEGLGEGPVQTLRRAVLIERAQLPALPAAEAPPPPQPQTGHATGRVDLLAGQRNGAAQWRLAWRPAYHDLGDTEAGFQRGAHIQFGALELSGTKGDGARLERFTPVEIVSLTPRDRLLGANSWKVRFGLARRFGRGDAEAPLVVDINGGPGRAWELGSTRRAMVFALMDNQLWWQPGGTLDAALDASQSRVAVGTGVHLGAIFDPTPAWRIQLDVRRRFFAGDNPIEQSYALRQRVAVTHELNLVAQCEWQQRGKTPARRDCLAGVQRYW